MKKIISLILAFIMVSFTSFGALAEIVYEEVVGEQKVSIGANLSDEQKNTVYSYFGIERGAIDEVIVTIDDERAYLQSFIDASKIGTRSLSSAYITLLEKGSGLDITLHNINWLTKETYANAFTTLGITDAKIIIASPISVSGTAALTGIYKSFEAITGEEIDEQTKEVATEELVTTGELADDIGSEEASALVNEIKMKADEFAGMDDEQVKTEIKDIAVNLNINLNDEQLGKLLSLVRSFENIDLTGVENTLKDISNKFDELFGDQESGFWASIKNFFVAIKDWFVSLFSGSNSDDDTSSVDSSSDEEDVASSTPNDEQTAASSVESTDDQPIIPTNESEPTNESAPDNQETIIGDLPGENPDEVIIPNDTPVESVIPEGYSYDD